MPHLFLMVAYSAIAVVINAINILMTSRIIKHSSDVFYYYVSMGQDGATIGYVLIGLVISWCAFYGMPPQEKNMFIGAFYVLAILLGITGTYVVVGIENIIWREPTEFIDLTWLFELVTLGFHALKWILTLSFTVSLAEIIQQPPPEVVEEQSALEMTPVSAMTQEMEMPRQPEPPAEVSAPKKDGIKYMAIPIYLN